VWSKPVGTSNAPDDDYTSENVIAVSLVEEANAYDALTRLKQLEAKSAIGLRPWLARCARRTTAGKRRPATRIGAAAWIDEGQRER
jgi:hypothetical protein